MRQIRQCHRRDLAPMLKQDNMTVVKLSGIALQEPKCMMAGEDRHKEATGESST